MTLENLILWTVVVHLVAQGFDNAVFKPFVLGKAVSLHPIVGTFYRQLKAYFLIY